MPVLSNNGRLISSLPVASSVSGQDELLLQSSGVTKRISYAALSSSILSSTNFSPFNATVNFTGTQNKFTGSFYNPDFKLSNFYTVMVRNSLSVSNGITGNLTGNVTSTGTSTFSSIDVNGGTIDGTTVGATSATTVRGTTITATTGFVGSLTGNVTSTGTSTFSNIDVNGGTIDGTTVGATSATTVRGTTITATTGFVGSLTGDLTGDVYNSTSTKVLENGNTTPTANGGVASAAFYGTSSYANQALTAAYASSGGSAINGVPSGGNQYQILAKNTNSNYDVGWTNPITASSTNGVGVDGYLTLWGGDRTLKNLNNFYWDGINSYVIEKQLLVNRGISVPNGAFTGSYRGNATDTRDITSLNQGRFLNGVKYSTISLELSQSGNVTMSLLDGQTSTVLVKNSGAYTVQHWSGSLNGSTANTKIYWKLGTEPTVTSGNLKQDLFTFVNVKNRIYGSADQNFS